MIIIVQNFVRKDLSITVLTVLIYITIYLRFQGYQYVKTDLMSSNTIRDNNDKLVVPQHSYNASISSTSSYGPVGYNLNPRPNKHGSSASRLSRTNSNNTDMYSNDLQSIKTTDRIPTAKPSVTYLDKLWTQIDVLDDVRNMSNQVKLKGSFFNDKFNQELEKLKQLQDKLFKVMAKQHFNSYSDKDYQKHLYKLSVTTPNASNPQLLNQISSETKDSEEPRDRTNERLTEFFAYDAQDLKHLLYKKQNLDEITHYIDDVKVSLDNVGESMKKFDESTRDLW